MLGICWYVWSCAGERLGRLDRMDDVEQLLAADEGAYVQMRGTHGFIRLADDDAWLALNRCSLSDYKPEAQAALRLERQRAQVLLAGA